MRSIPRPCAPISQLISQRHHKAPLPDSEWPPGAVPSLDNPSATTEFTPLLSKFLISILARLPVETPPTAYLPYPPPPNYQWPPGYSPETQNPNGDGSQSQGQGGSASSQSQDTAPGGGGSVPGPPNGRGKSATHLTPGAIAGIVIGVPVGLLIFAWIIWRTRKVRRRKKATVQGGGGSGQPPMTERDEEGD